MYRKFWPSGDMVSLERDHFSRYLFALLWYCMFCLPNMKFGPLAFKISMRAIVTHWPVLFALGCISNPVMLPEIEDTNLDTSLFAI